MITTNTKSRGWVAGLFTAVVASLCCITPFLALLGGASGFASSFSWIDPYRHYLIGLTVVAFSFAWYQKLKHEKQSNCKCETDLQKPFLKSTLFLGIITVVAALLIAFPYYANIFYPKQIAEMPAIANKNNLTELKLNIEGMNCEACTLHINGELYKVDGVVDANTSYKNNNAVVRYDSTKTAADSLINVVANIGYKVTSSNIIKK